MCVTGRVARVRASRVVFSIHCLAQFPPLIVSSPLLVDMIIARLISLSILCGGCVGVATLPPPNATCGTLALGHKHTCVVSSMRGRVRCWGAGDFGELGYGSLQNIGSAPGTVPALVDDVAVLGDAAAVVQVSAGFGHTCALLDKGTVRCWGNGANGRLGYGDELPRNVPSDDDVAVSPTNRVVQIAAGGYHTCALLDNGLARCWGLDDDGQLGYGKIDYPSQVRMVLLPASVGDVNVSTTHAVVQITTGMYRAARQRRRSLLGLRRERSSGLWIQREPRRSPEHGAGGGGRRQGVADGARGASERGLRSHVCGA